MSKPMVDVYLNTKAPSTKVLTEHLAKYIDDLNQILLINFIYITDKNAPLVKKRGVRRTPTLKYGKRTYEGLEKIIRVLTPPKSGKETYGYGNTNPDEMLHEYQNEIIDNRADDEQEDQDDMNGDARTQQIRSRIAAFQKRRPKMDGVGQKQKIAGGRKIKSKFNQKEYAGSSADDDFLKDSGVGSIDQTPTERYVEDTDGELILEDYYLNEAIANGKVQKQGKGRRH